MADTDTETTAPAGGTSVDPDEPQPVEIQIAFKLRRTAGPGTHLEQVAKAVLDYLDGAGIELGDLLEVDDPAAEDETQYTIDSIDWVGAAGPAEG